MGFVCGSQVRGSQSEESELLKGGGALSLEGFC